MFQTPWLEATILEAGASRVTTLEYIKIKSQHPKVKTVLPADFMARFSNGSLEKFDFAVSFSSLEHSGLGRYSDGLNPYGDLIAMARIW